MTWEVIPDRQCGTCNACCVVLTINDEALQKLQGYRCKNSTSTGGCAIYPDRPDTCRRFQCGWRMLKWVNAGMRPDRSGVLIRFQQHVTEGLGIIVMLLNAQSWKAEGLAEAVAAAVSAGLPVYLHVPGPPGYTSAQARIDGALAHAVATRDKPGVLKILREGRRQAKGGKFEPIRLKAPGSPVSPAES